jgi:hypothetical protein
VAATAIAAAVANRSLPANRSTVIVVPGGGVCDPQEATGVDRSWSTIAGDTAASPPTIVTCATPSRAMASRAAAESESGAVRSTPEWR